VNRTKLRKFISAVRASLLSLADCFVPKSADIWIFPVYFLGKGSLCDNSLAVLRSIPSDVKLRIFILTHNEIVKLEDSRCTSVKMSSYRATWLLLRCGAIFAQHSLWLDYAKAKFHLRRLNRRVIVNLWHGIPIKDLSHANTGIQTRLGLREMPHYLIPCASEVDRQSMRTAFDRTPRENFWITGIPRNDFLSCEESSLPKSYLAQLTELRTVLGGRRLVLYAPTYRETPQGGEYLEFTPAQIQSLGNLLKSQSAVLGVRFHSYRQPNNQAGLLNLKEAIDLSGDFTDDVRLLVREASVVITDYSSISLDAIYAHVPLICFAYDLEHYKQEQRGFFYSLQEIFGESIARNYGELEALLTTSLSRNPGKVAEGSAAQQQFAERIFAYRDDGNGSRFSKRLLEHVQARFRGM